MMLTFAPRELGDLFPVFDALAAGNSVALGPAPEGETAPDYPTFSAGSSVYLGLFSSGTTGVRKRIWWPWNELASSIRVSDRNRGWTWASAFHPESYAGVQVALHAWRSQGRVVSLTNDWPNAWRQIDQSRPSAVSCTPTFLDLLLQFEAQSEWTPAQVTLGGEVLRPRTGQRFAARFPSTRFTVIYASAEHGVLLRTHRLDGWYETDQLEARRIGWRIRDEALELCRNGEWIATRDRAESGHGLIRILGRRDAVANVGGVKVSLPEVESRAEEVPGVRRAAAYVLESEIVGQIVGLRFSLEHEAERELVQPRLEQHLRRCLRKEAWPRVWQVDLVGLGANSKRARAL